ncbi:hypothetical protein L6164_016894 [Bauhinia variegata]|uniref:Uncharacterized protein n=1 Tax=Bauhinia variegata TaxID=167791 RepID=A0ACB9N629_BAUVA|nr:hypothetical protein L6164_016894 [Bauhinia variegata]
MVKFSIDGDDDGEGPSNPRQKRQRISVLLGTAGEDVEEQSGTAEEELEGEESEQEQEGMQSEENDDPTFVNNDDGTPLSIRLRSNNSGREDAVSMMNDDDTPLGIRLRSINSGTENAVSVIKGRGKYVSVFLTEPEVLDCFICYEPLSIPVFQEELECSSNSSRKMFHYMAGYHGLGWLESMGAAIVNILFKASGKQ